MKRQLIKLLKKYYGEFNVNAGNLYKDWRGWIFTPFGASEIVLGKNLSNSCELVEMWNDNKYLT
jgi:hypothetical protein